MNYRLSLIALMMITLSPLTQAEPEANEDLPTIELLEFLGEWETSDKITSARHERSTDSKRHEVFRGKREDALLESNTLIERTVR